mmetsp:Transcript_55769/g.83059  ORF Transcript_55769/g.83059 Transcript_55769/m.83059 type:complete len:141 (+) Transcript_55769:123-545(+)
MPPPEMKTITITKPSLLTLNPKHSTHLSSAMIPTPLRTTLTSQSSPTQIALITLPQFGYLYTCLDSQIHEYEPNLLTNPPLAIYYKLGADSKVYIGHQDLEEHGLYFFGIYSMVSMAQARIVAKEMEGVLGYTLKECQLH